MEKKKDLSWDEIHPNGDLSYHTFLDSFEDISTLNGVEVKVALRTLKYYLEEEIGYELSDKAFQSSSSPTFWWVVFSIWICCSYGKSASGI